MPHSQSNSKKSVAGMGNIRQVSKTKNGRTYTYWEGRFTVGYDPGTGKQIQRTVSGKTKREVTQKLKAALAEIDAGTYKEPCKLTLGEHLDTWLSESLRDAKPLTQGTYAEAVKRHIKPALGAIKLEALDRPTIQRFYNGLTESKHLSPKTVKNIHGVLHKALQEAVLCDYILKNPATGCSLPKVQRPEIKPLEPSQTARMLEEAEKDDYCNLLIVALFTGMRQGELLGLSWDCVDFTTGTITVKQQLQCKDGNYFMSTPKNGKRRTILPAPMVMDALRQERQKQLTAWQQAGDTWNNPYNLVFTDPLGKHLVRRTVVKHFKAVAERVGVPDARFHDMRHSFAVNSLQAGDDIKTVQSNLGHATAAFTLDVYGHVTEKMQRDSAARMQQFYEQIRK